MIPDYLIYDELKERDEHRRDGGLEPLHLPLYRPDVDDWRRDHEEDESQDEETTERGVIIIDMNTGLEIAAD